jgi:hypothetical protein
VKDTEVSNVLIPILSHVNVVILQNKCLLRKVPVLSPISHRSHRSLLRPTGVTFLTDISGYSFVQNRQISGSAFYRFVQTLVILAICLFIFPAYSLFKPLAQLYKCNSVSWHFSVSPNCILKVLYHSTEK